MIFISLLSSVFACLVCFTDTGGKIFVPRFNNASFSLFFKFGLCCLQLLCMQDRSNPRSTGAQTDVLMTYIPELRC